MDVDVRAITAKERTLSATARMLSMQGEFGLWLSSYTP